MNIKVCEANIKLLNGSKFSSWKSLSQNEDGVVMRYASKNIIFCHVPKEEMRNKRDQKYEFTKQSFIFPLLYVMAF